MSQRLQASALVEGALKAVGVSWSTRPANRRLFTFMGFEANDRGCTHKKRAENSAKKKNPHGVKFIVAAENEGSSGFPIITPCALIEAFALLLNTALSVPRPPAATRSPLAKLREKLHQIYRTGFPASMWAPAVTLKRQKMFLLQQTVSQRKKKKNVILHSYISPKAFPRMH